MLHLMITLLILLVSVGCLVIEPKELVAEKVHAEVHAEPKVGNNLASNGDFSIPMNHSNVDQVIVLEKYANRLRNMKALFTKPKGQDVAGSQFAEGALSHEMANSGSEMWSAITSMATAAEQAKAQLKSHGNLSRKQIMKALEADMDSTASRMSKVLQRTNLKQKTEDEEYLLGLLNMHREWSMRKQINVTAMFVNNSHVIRELYNHHDPSKPLAMQLAKLMDA